MTIKSAITKNYQNISEAIFEFDPLINIISGSSDNGKSAALKSLIWNIRNNPSGYNFKPHNLKRGGLTSTDIVYDDCTVKKERGKSSHKYILNDDENNPFEAFGQSVPPQITSLINIPDYCIQTQFEHHFLLGDSPGQVAKKINDVCDLSIIHETSAIIDSKVSNAKNDLKYVQETLEEKETEIASFDYVDAFEKLTSVIGEQLNEANKLEESITILENSLEYIDNLERVIKEKQVLLLLETDVKALLLYIGEYLSKSKDYNKLVTTVHEIDTLESKQLEAQKIIIFDDEISQLIEDIDRYNISKENYENLKNTLAELEILLNNSFPIIDLGKETIELIQKVKTHISLIDRKNKLESSYLYLNDCIDQAENIEETRKNLQNIYDEYYSTLEKCKTCGNITCKEDL